MLLTTFIKDARASLEGLYAPEERSCVVSRLCQELLGIPPYEHVVNPSRELAPDSLRMLETAMQRISRGEPLQYVLGFQEFYGRRFNVSPYVLIPRPETEYMCSLAIQELKAARSPRRVLDLCTGSGCIAWTVALEAEATALGVDISPEALAVARGQGFDADVSFAAGDILTDIGLDGEFDMVLSNPPYVRDMEKAFMKANVLDYEPSIALFVPDTDPLVFYRAIARIAGTYLREGGSGYVEINEALGNGTAEVFRKAGFSDISVLKDLSGKDRYVHFSGLA